MGIEYLFHRYQIIQIEYVAHLLLRYNLKGQYSNITRGKKELNIKTMFFLFINSSV